MEGHSRDCLRQDFVEMETSLQATKKDALAQNFTPNHLPGTITRDPYKKSHITSIKDPSTILRHVPTIHTMLSHT